MEVKPRSADERATFTVLVTGANSGLGYATCCRVIDEFLITRPQSQNLHLLFSTRDTRKGNDTLKRLNAHFQRTLKAANAQTPGISLLLEPRVKLEGVLVDLTKLLTIKALARQLLARNQHLDAVIWNAGVAGWSGVNYPKATWDILTNTVEASTCPEFMICDVGLLTGRQIAGQGQFHTFPEPGLGEVFTANVFGHYMLTHWLAPLMGGETRIIWCSSTSATPDKFNVDDLQGIRSSMAYESSKRLTDLLVVTSNLPSTRPLVNSFLPTSTHISENRVNKSEEQPRMYIAHPGVVATSISGVNWFISILMIAAMYMARWVGSPWHPIQPYKGAVSAVFVALAPQAQLAELDMREGKGKWGSAADVFGNERVVRTEIEGWGFGGELGVKPSGSLTVRRKAYEKTTKEMRENFEETGRRVWREMEVLRLEWEKRLGSIAVESSSSIDV